MSPERERNIIIHPRKGKNEDIIPQTGVLFVNPTEAQAAAGRLKDAGGFSRFLFNSQLTLDKSKFFFAAGPAIGSPMATLVLEKLIALDARRIILFGWCGAVSDTLQVGDILIPSRALSGEGTSQYYPVQSSPAPHPVFRDRVESFYAAKKIDVSAGCVWSTDAIFREDRAQLQNLNRKNGVVAVDMEFSALCTVACFRQVEFCAVLVVSDELYRSSWRPGFSDKTFLKSKQEAINVLFENMSLL